MYTLNVNYTYGNYIRIKLVQKKYTCEVPVTWQGLNKLPFMSSSCFPFLQALVGTLAELGTSFLQQVVLVILEVTPAKLLSSLWNLGVQKACFCLTSLLNRSCVSVWELSLLPGCVSSPECRWRSVGEEESHWQLPPIRPNQGSTGWESCMGSYDTNQQLQSEVPFASPGWWACLQFLPAQHTQDLGAQTGRRWAGVNALGLNPSHCTTLCSQHPAIHTHPLIGFPASSI